MVEYGGQPHDAYGKHVMREATQGAFCDSGPRVRVNLGNGSFASIDGVVCDVAIEIDSRVSKQVRGALVDLLLHAAPKKLLVLLPVHMSNPKLCARQCRFVLDSLAKPGQKCRVLVLSGHGKAPQLEADVALVHGTLEDMG